MRDVKNLNDKDSDSFLYKNGEDNCENKVVEYTSKSSTAGQGLLLGQPFGLVRKSNKARRSVRVNMSMGNGDNSFTVVGSNMQVDANFQDNDFGSHHYNEKLLNESKLERVKKARLYTAIKTPYTYSGRIDLNVFDQLVEF